MQFQGNVKISNCVVGRRGEKLYCEVSLQTADRLLTLYFAVPTFIFRINCARVNPLIID